MENKETTETIVKDETPKKQKTSATYTLRAFGTNIKKLKELELIDDKDAKTLQEIANKAVTKYVTG